MIQIGARIIITLAVGCVHRRPSGARQKARSHTDCPAPEGSCQREQRSGCPRPKPHRRCNDPTRHRGPGLLPDILTLWEYRRTVNLGPSMAWQRNLTDSERFTCYETDHANHSWRSVGMLAVDRRRNGLPAKFAERWRGSAASHPYEWRSEADRGHADRSSGTTRNGGRSHRPAINGPRNSEVGSIRRTAKSACRDRPPWQIA